jgi:hypothetical protein
MKAKSQRVLKTKTNLGYHFGIRFMKMSSNRYIELYLGRISYLVYLW